MISQTYKQAVQHATWCSAMCEEIVALVKNKTWTLVPKSQAQNVIGCKWVFQIKHKQDVTIDRYTGILVAKGFHQRPGVDFTSTFSPVVKPTTIHLLLTLLSTSNGLSISSI